MEPIDLELKPEQALIASALQLAIRDLSSKDERLRQDALMFFDESESLHVWCEILNLEPSLVIRQLGKGAADLTLDRGPATT